MGTTLCTDLPELSLAPVLRDPNIAVGVDATISPTGRINKDSNLVVAVKGYTHGGVPAGHMEVLGADLVDRVGDAPVLLDAAEVHDLVVDLGVGEGGYDEEEGAQGCEEHCEAGETDHCRFCCPVCRENFDRYSVVLQTTEGRIFVIWNWRRKRVFLEEGNRFDGRVSASIYQPKWRSV